MIKSLSVVLPNDPVASNALPTYRKILSYLKEHPNVDLFAKMELNLLVANSRLTATLEHVYHGLFKIPQEEMKNPTMETFIKILFSKIVPNMNVIIEESNGQLTVETDGTMYTGDDDAGEFPPTDIPATTYETPVAHVETTVQESATSSVTTKMSTRTPVGKVDRQNETVTLVTPNQLTMDRRPANPTKTVNQPTDQNVHNVQSLHNKSDTLELVTGNNRELCTTHGEHLTATVHQKDKTQDGIDGFIPVEEGTKHAVRTRNVITEKNITENADSKSTNSFAILQHPDDDDEHTTQSPILLPGQPKKAVLEKLRSIATTPVHSQKSTQNKNQKLKKQPTPHLPGNFSQTDKKYRNHPNGFNLIEQKLTSNKHDDLSLNDLAWYITTAKPRIGHIQGQIRGECAMIHRGTIKEIRASCQSVTDHTTIELNRIATAECNKLNNTSQKIMVEMRKAETVQEKLHSLNNVCSQLLESLGNRGCLYVTRVELDHDLEKLHAMIKTAGLNQGTTTQTQSNTNDIGRLQAKITLMQADIAEMFSTTPVNTIKEQLQNLEIEVKDLQRKYEVHKTQLADVHHLRENVRSLEKDLMATNQTVTELTNFIKDQFKQQTKAASRPQPSRNKLSPDVDPATIGHAAHHHDTHPTTHGYQHRQDQSAPRPDVIPLMQQGH